MDAVSQALPTNGRAPKGPAILRADGQNKLPADTCALTCLKCRAPRHASHVIAAALSGRPLVMYSNEPDSRGSTLKISLKSRPLAPTSRRSAQRPPPADIRESRPRYHKAAGKPQQQRHAPLRIYFTRCRTEPPGNGHILPPLPLHPATTPSSRTAAPLIFSYTARASDGPYASPFSVTQRSITAATSSLFVSNIMACPLPRTPHSSSRM